MTSGDQTLAHAPESIEARVFAAQVELVYRQSLRGMIGTLGVTVCLVVVLGKSAPRAWLVGWVGLMVALQALRLGVRQAYFRAPVPTHQAGLWAARMEWGNVGVGLCYGLSCAVLTPDLHRVEGALFMVLMCGVAMSGVVLFTPVAGLYAKFFLPILIPLLVWAILPGTSAAWIAGAVVILAGLISLTSAREFHGRIAETLLLRFEHQDLVERLNHSRLELEAALHEAEAARVLAELEREHAREARVSAEQASQAKTAFLANMSHEIRTPMNAILGFAEFMRRDSSLSPRQQEHLAIIQRSGDALLNLINGVLDLSKVEAGGMHLHEAPFGLPGLAGDLTQMFALRAQEKGLHLRAACDPSVPSWVTGDEGKLRQVLVNLLGNALKFTFAGEVALEISPEARGIRFAVSDTGPGIAPEEQAQLFQAFTQTAAGRASKQGTGLGLALSAQLVRLMGGRLEVASAPGQGTVFQFTLPLPPSEAAASPKREVEAAVRALAPGQGPWTILVADDMAESRAVLVRFLDLWGFKVLEAAHGQEAVERWEAHRPDLVFMDMRMPVLSGREATQRIKALSGGQALVVAQSASAFEEELDSFLQAGCDRSLRKPLRIPEVVRVLEELLGARFERDGGGTPGLPSLSGAAPGLDAASREALAAAVRMGDLEAVLALANRLPPAQAAVAERLRALAMAFDLAGLTLLAES